MLARGFVFGILRVMTQISNVPALLAFDLDGTLADTESLSLIDLFALLQETFDIPMTVDHWWEAGYHGMSGEPLMAKLNAEYGKGLEWKTFFPIRSARLPRVFGQGIPAAPGMLQALKAAAVAGHQMCVCSNSDPQRVALSLTQITGQHSAGLFLDKMFDGHTFSANNPHDPAHSLKPKPAPDVYQTASIFYGVDPAQCVAVEDSVIGVQAAVAAGFRCIGYTGLSKHPNHATDTLQAAGATVLMNHWDDFMPTLNTLF